MRHDAAFPAIVMLHCCVTRAAATRAEPAIAVNPQSRVQPQLARAIGFFNGCYHSPLLDDFQGVDGKCAVPPRLHFNCAAVLSQLYGAADGTAVHGELEQRTT